jgi:trans-2,3-dihydro-3-hydroxyanthranilate isomerase
MKSYRFRIVNVFTRGRDRFSGNPLCVFEDAAGLDDAAMQAIARQFNLSETTFIFPPDTEAPAAPAPDATALVRIYTPAYEMPFAGHPTLGTAHVCRALGLAGDSLKLRMEAGVIPVAAAKDRWTLTAKTGIARELNEPRAALAAALGVEESDIGERPLWIDAGNEQLVVPLTSENAVRAATPDAQKFSLIRNKDNLPKVYVFHAGKTGKVLARFFFPQGPVMLEDPATGSATANFGGWWVAMNKALPCSLTISQGEYVQRPSTLYLDVGKDSVVKVSGEVIEVGQGSFEV